MSDPSTTDETDVPQWVRDLVPVADHARGLLLGSLPVAGAVVVVVAGAVLLSRAATDATIFTVVAVLAHCLAGLVLVHRLSGRTARGAQGTPPVALRPGARTLTRLLVLDIVGTLTGLLTLAAGALTGTDGALATGALAAAALIAVGVLGIAVAEVTTGGLLVAGAGALVVAAASCAVVLTAAVPGWGVWALTVVLVVLADVVGLLALRRGARRDRAGRG